MQAKYQKGRASMGRNERWGVSVVVTSAIMAVNAGDALAWDTNLDYRGGHHFITQKAIQYLTARGLWAPEMDPAQAESLIQYGNAFADMSYLGRPEDPLGAFPSVLDKYPLPEHCWIDREGFRDCAGYETILGSAQQCHETGCGKPIAEVDICADGIMAWYKRPNWVLDVKLTIKVDADILIDDLIDYKERNRVLPFTVDNLFHFDFGSDLSQVVLYPFQNPALCDAENDHLNGAVIYHSMQVGTSAYGAVLYQLARKFMGQSWAEPVVTELPRVGPNGQFANGRVNPYNRSVYSNIDLAMPSTYLGGQPYICANANPSLRPCETGAPTWPIWVPEVTSPSFIDDLVRTRAVRSNRAAMIYLGWAAHMIQDASMPHHAGGYTGEAHQAIDNGPAYLADATTINVCDEGSHYRPRECSEGRCFFGNCDDGKAPTPHLVDEYFQRGLDAVFGTPSAPRDRARICADLGITDDTVVPGRLNWEPMQWLFDEVAYDATQDLVYSAEPGFDEFSGGHLPRVKSAIAATMKLLACVKPIASLPPALIVASVLAPLQ